MQRGQPSTGSRSGSRSGRRNISWMAKSGWKENGTAMFRWLDRHKLALAAAGLMAVSVGVLPAQQPTVFHDTVTQVHVIASVKNAKGELVGTLQMPDFTILDNGVE